MGLSVTTTIFLFVVCLCGGIVIGAMFGRMRREQTAKSDEQEDETSAETDQQEEETQEPEAAAGLARQDEIEILRAWQNEQGGIWLEMDKQRLESRDDLSLEQRKRLLGMVLYLRPWLEPASASSPAPAPTQAPVPTPSQPVQAAPAPEPSAPPPAAPQPIKASTDIHTTPPPDAPAVSLKSMVEQIDDVLQEKLAGSPFEKLNIKLKEGPGGEVVVQIGTMRHAGVDAIPNQEIRAFIRQAVAEWERRSR